MPSHPFVPQQSLFKAYDIRGDRALFTTDFITCLSEAFVEHFLISNAQTIVVGYDARHGSNRMARQLADGFIQHGIEVIWLGLVTTPMMAFWANEYQGHGMVITASHSEGHINGIKWLCAGQSPSKEDIQNLYANLTTVSDNVSINYDTKGSKASFNQIAPHHHGQLNSPHGQALKKSAAGLVTLSADQVATAYFSKIADALDQIKTSAQFAPSRSLVSSKTYRPLKVVIDCLNGATAPYAQALFSQFDELCDSVIVLNNQPNGDFPKGNPDPTEAGRLEELQQAVLAHQADFGLGFDGDGDRLMVVDNQGQVLAPDHLLYLLAHIAIVERPITSQLSQSSQPPQSSSAYTHKALDQAPMIIFDVKCSHHLPKLIEQIGGYPQMGKTGSSIMRKALQNGSSNAIFAGELSGHFLFNDGYFILHDDAMYAGLRLLNWLLKQSLSLADIIGTLPTMVNTPDVYLPLTLATDACNQERPLLQKLSKLCLKLQSCCPTLANNDPTNDGATSLGQSAPISQSNPLGLPLNTRLTCIDGIRLDFSSGFGVIRPSNTSHSLTVRFAGNTLADLRAVQQRFVDLCQFIDSDLASQIAKITPSL